eukprot:gene15009-16717_t
MELLPKNVFLNCILPFLSYWNISQLSPYTYWRVVYGSRWSKSTVGNMTAPPGYYIDHNLASWLAPHLKIVKDVLSLRYWPNVMSFEFSSTLHTLHLMFCYVSKLSLVANIKNLHLDRCNIELLELFAHDLWVLKFSQVSTVDLKRIKPCKKLIINQVDCLLNEEELKHYEYLEINVSGDLTLHEFPWKKIQVLKVRAAHLNIIPSVPFDSSSIGSQNLKFVELDVFNPRYRIDLRWFSMVHELKLSGSGKGLSLEGLQNTPRIVLKNMSTTSLIGLKSNDYVAVINCGEVTDFSPLKHVREVLIENCDGLSDGRHLSNVKNLYLKNCKNIDCLVGLEKIPKFKILNCPGLRGALKANRIYERDFGTRVINNPLTKLPDTLLIGILDYLKS